MGFVIVLLLVFIIAFACVSDANNKKGAELDKFKAKERELNTLINQARTEKEIQAKELKKLRSEAELKIEQTITNAEHREQKAAEMEHYYSDAIESLDKLIREKGECYPHIAAIMADLLTIHYERSAKYLETKKPPAYGEASRIRELREKTKQILKEKKALEYTLKEINAGGIVPPSASSNKCNIDVNLLREEQEDLQIERDALFETVANLRSEVQELKDQLDYWNQEAETAREIARNNLPKAFLSESIVREYIGSMSTMRLDKAINDKMRFEVPLHISASVHSESGEIYQTSLTYCNCEDFKRHQKPCKHMIALALKTRILTPYTDELKKLINTLSEQLTTIAEKEKFVKENRKALGQAKEELNQIQKFIDEKQQSYPWLANLIATYRIEKYDIHVKSPVTKRELTAAIKRAEREKALLSNQLAVYEYMFPILNAFKELPPDSLVANISEAKSTGFNYNWLSEEEYKILTSVEKQQLWIKKYFEHRSKNAWEAGIKYERYVGYLCEKEGCTVKYTGALLKLNDMGRDLIATQGNTIYIIQCKRFSAGKEIHENHLFQLFGSTCHYSAEHPNKKVVGVFVTTSCLSDVARECAKKLDIVLYENLEFKEYPIIKCNIGKSGEKIYHLPFDQQYDNVAIKYGTEELYVSTIKEAEKLGFRHAMKHKVVS